MFCRNCGNEISEDAHFCGKCGTPVEQETPVVTEAPAAETAVSEAVEAVQAPVAIAEEAEPVVEQYAEPTVDPVVEDAFIPEPEIVEEVTAEIEFAPKKEKNKFVSGLLGAVSCLLIFVIMFGAFALLTIRAAINSENIIEVSKKVDDSVMEEIIMENVELSKSKKQNAEIAEEIVSGSIPEFVVEKIGEYGDYLLGGKKPAEVKSSEVIKLLIRNRKVADLLVGEIGPYQDQAWEYEKYFEDKIAPGLDEIYENESLDKTLDIARVILSVWFLAGFGVVLLLLVFMNVMTRTKKTASLNWLGWTFIVTGGLYVIAYIAALIFNSMIPGLNETMKALIGIALGSIWLDATIIGGSVVVAGVLMVVVKSIIKKVCAKKAQA